MKSIHKLAEQLLTASELPSLRNTGLCYLFAEMQQDWLARTATYAALNECMPAGCYTYLPFPGVWTEQRLNAVCLLACTTEEDFL